MGDALFKGNKMFPLIFVSLFVTLMGACVPEKSTNDEPDPTATGTAGAKKDGNSVSNDAPSNVIIRKPGDPLGSTNTAGGETVDTEKKNSDETLNVNSATKKPENTTPATDKITEDTEVKAEDGIVADDNYPKPPSNKTDLGTDITPKQTAQKSCSEMFGIAGVTVAMRKGAGSQYEQIGTIAHGESVKPEFISLNWIVVQKGNIKGYVYKIYLSCNKNEKIGASHLPANSVQKKTGEACN